MKRTHPPNLNEWFSSKASSEPCNGNVSRCKGVKRKRTDIHSQDKLKELSKGLKFSFRNLFEKLIILKPREVDDIIQNQLCSDEYINNVISCQTMLSSFLLTEQQDFGTSIGQQNGNSQVRIIESFKYNNHILVAISVSYPGYHMYWQTFHSLG